MPIEAIIFIIIGILVVLFIGFSVGKSYGRSGYFYHNDLIDARNNLVSQGNREGINLMLQWTASGKPVVSHSDLFTIAKYYKVIRKIDLTKLKQSKIGIYFLLLDMTLDNPVPVLVRWGDVLVLSPSKDHFGILNLEEDKNYLIKNSPITKRHQEFLDDTPSNEYSLYAEEIA